LLSSIFAFSLCMVHDWMTPGFWITSSWSWWPRKSIWHWPLRIWLLVQLYNFWFQHLKGNGSVWMCTFVTIATTLYWKEFWYTTGAISFL
jgi:hypothetical protein